MLERLFRYSPIKRDLQIEDTNRTVDGYILTFGVDGKLKGVSGVFLTPMDPMGSPDAKRYLALGFDPFFRYEWSYPCDIKEPSVFQNPYGGTFPSRVWPAYGEDGGGWEILLTSGDLKYGMGTQLLENDPLHALDMDGNRSGPLRDALLRAIWDWFNQVASVDSSKNEPPVVLIDGSRLIFSWRAESGRRYALSCGIGYPEQTGTTKVYFWYYGWIDDKSMKHRRIWGPSTGEALFTCTKEDVKLKESDKLNELLNRLRASLLELVKNNNCREISLP